EERRQKEEEKANTNQQILVMIDGSKSGLANLNQELDRQAKFKHNVKPHVKVVEKRYVVEQITAIAATAPKHLVVVIDGSKAMAGSVADITKALEKLPVGITTELMIATQEEQAVTKAIPLSLGIAKLKQTKFVGGQDNLKAVVEASELAGKTEGG